MFHIIEIQSSNHYDETTGQWSIAPSAIVAPIPQYSDLNEAKSAFYSKLAIAYLSTVDIHAVAMIDHTGAVVLSECVYHGQGPENAE
jgi:hypothetical protein